MFLSDDGSDQESENIDILKQVESPLNLHRFNFQETLFIPNVLSSEEVRIALGEGKQTTLMLNDESCEEPAFPYIFPMSTFCYKVSREIKPSPSKYFNQSLFNHIQLFASDPDYKFFALSITQHFKFQSQINVRTKKVCIGNLTTGVLFQILSERVKSFIAKDEARHFMRIMKGNAASWKKFLYDVLAIVKQFGLPFWNKSQFHHCDFKQRKNKRVRYQ